ncbi:MAG: hypothetical protein ACYC2K_15320, partial [Gemmatimonadales bacterium]
MQLAHLIPLLGATLMVASGRPAFPGGTERAPTSPSPSTPSSLARWHDGRWQIWWRSDRAPAAWSDSQPVLASGLRWSSTAPGIELAQLKLAGSREAWRIRLIVVRLDPKQLALGLETAYTAGGQPAWQADRVGADVLFAVNAGQFLRSAPWGWLVQDGTERLSPGVGPLSTALVIDEAGQVSWIEGDSLPARRYDGRARFAFQSYPA